MLCAYSVIAHIVLQLGVLILADIMLMLNHVNLLNHHKKYDKINDAYSC